MFLGIGGALPSTSLAEQLGRALPPFQRELDALVIPACGRDDVQGLFGLNESVRIGAVYWACNPERLQTTRRLYAAFQEAGITQRRLQAEDSLLLDPGASIGFELGEDSLRSLRLQSGDFSALIQYEALTNPEPASLWIGAFAANMPEVPILLTVGPPPLTNPARDPESRSLIVLVDWTWVEAITDGRELRIVAVK